MLLSVLIAGEDYTSISEAIDLSLATDFRVCMTVNIIDDILALEANEQFIVQLDIDILMRSRLVQFGENSETSITIIDDDGRFWPQTHTHTHAHPSLSTHAHDSLTSRMGAFHNCFQRN